MRQLRRHWVLTGAAVTLAVMLLGGVTQGCAEQATSDKSGLEVTTETDALRSASTKRTDHGGDKDRKPEGRHPGHKPPKGGGKGNTCPTIEAVTATPNEAEIGNTIALTSSASDPDKKPGGALSYQWSVTGGGTFTDASAQNTEFTCAQPGTQTITITVSESEQSCAVSASLSVTCIAGDVAPCANPSGEEETLSCNAFQAGQRGQFPRRFDPAEAQELAHELLKVARADLDLKVEQGGTAWIEAVKQLAASDDICRRITGWSCIDVLYRTEQ